MAREGEPNSVSFGGENNKQQAAQDANSDRQHNQELPCFIRWRGIETLNHILVEQSNSYENQQRSEGVEEIDEPKPVFGSLFIRKSDRGVNDPQASKRGDPISDFASFVPKTVGEEEEKTGEGAEGDKAKCGGLADLGVALALVREYGGQNLEAEDGPCWEKIGQMGSSFEGLSYGLLGRRFCWLSVCCWGIFQ